MFSFFSLPFPQGRSFADSLPRFALQRRALNRWSWTLLSLVTDAVICHSTPTNSQRFHLETPERRLCIADLRVSSVEFIHTDRNNANLKGTSFPLKIACTCGLWPTRSSTDVLLFSAPERVRHGQRSCSVPGFLSGDPGVCGSHRRHPTYVGASTAYVGASFITASSSTMGLWMSAWTSSCQITDLFWTCRYGCQLDLWGRG